MFALIASVLCLALNAFFVAAEFALVKVRVTQLDRALKRGDRRAIAAKEVLLRLDRYLSVTQFGITVASLGLGWLGEPALTRLADTVAIAIRGAPLGGIGHGMVDVIGLAFLTFLHLLLGELVPKFIAIQHPEKTSLVAALPLQIVNGAFRPVLWVLEHAQRAVLRLLRIDPNTIHEGTMTEDELIGVLASQRTWDRRSEDKRRLVERVLRFGTRPLRGAMVPRVDVVSLGIDRTGEEAYALMRRHEYSRILLTNGSIDEVCGYLYAKDFLLDPGARSRTTLRGLERRVLFLPETRDAFSALRDMQREAIPFAVVIDEYGGTSGIATLEDLVEEIVGEIRDELDVEPPRVALLPGQTSEWTVDGQATLDDLRDVGVPVLEEWSGEPIGRVVIEQLGRLPKVGDAVRIAENVIAEVVATSRSRIRSLRVRAVRPAENHA